MEQANDEEIRMEIAVPDKEFMDDVYNYCFAMITQRMALDPNSNKYNRYFKDLKSKVLGMHEDGFLRLSLLYFHYYFSQKRRAMNLPSEEELNSLLLHKIKLS